MKHNESDVEQQISIHLSAFGNIFVIEKESLNYFLIWHLNKIINVHTDWYMSVICSYQIT